MENYRTQIISCQEIVFKPWLTLILLVSQCEASYSVANFLPFSNPADAQNVSCLGRFGKDIYPKSYV